MTYVLRIMYKFFPMHLISIVRYLPKVNKRNTRTFILFPSYNYIKTCKKKYKQNKYTPMLQYWSFSERR